MKQSRKQVRGFTLLELLIALAIFGLVSVMSYSGLRAVLEQQSRTQAAVDRLAELQKIYLLVQRDVEQAIPRVVRSEYGDELVAFGGDVNNLQLTRGGWRNPLQHPRSSLQRVAYAIVDDALTRYTWSVLDRAQDTLPLAQPLTAAVRTLQLRYLNDQNAWLTQWPDPATSTSLGAATPPPAGPNGTPPAAVAVTPEDWPRAVEITLEHEHYGRLVWLFRVGI